VTGAKVLGTPPKSDAPKIGRRRPVVASTICWKSVRLSFAGAGVAGVGWMVSRRAVWVLGSAVLSLTGPGAVAGIPGLTAGTELALGAVAPAVEAPEAACDRANPGDPAQAESATTRDSILLAAASRIGLEDLCSIFICCGFRPDSILAEKSI
jgi:hypothetical protein